MRFPKMAYDEGEKGVMGAITEMKIGRLRG